MKRIFVIVIGLLIISFSFMQCRKGLPNDKINTYASLGISTKILNAVDSLYKEKQTKFITITFFSVNDSNFVSFVNSAIMASIGSIPIFDRPNFAGYKELKSSECLFFWKSCDGSIFERFVQKDSLNKDESRFNTLIKTDANTGQVIDLTKTIFYIDANDDLVFVKTEYI